MPSQPMNFDIKGDALGYLIPLESLKNVPFEIKRAYVIYGIDVKDVRGKHAHKKLHQLLLCVHGRCTVMLESPSGKVRIQLDKPNQAVLIEPMVWHEMQDFSSDCVLLGLADDLYNEKDYIRNYEEYLKFTHGSK
jgi:dTDP-4-dehydrorhamnose 3,5-epimerase-like enzyme